MNKTEKIVICVDEQFMQWIKEEAKREDMKVSVLARRMLNEIKKEKDNAEPNTTNNPSRSKNRKN